MGSMRCGDPGKGERQTPGCPHCEQNQPCPDQFLLIRWDWLACDGISHGVPTPRRVLPHMMVG
jgi:hypothetical protein